MAISKNTVPTPTLYESQWWMRLAAISEKAESSPVEARDHKSEGFLKALSSLFEPLPGGNLITSIVKTN